MTTIQPMPSIVSFLVDSANYTDKDLKCLQRHITGSSFICCHLKTIWINLHLYLNSCVDYIYGSAELWSNSIETRSGVRLFRK